jgi:hypothetical protein
VAVISFTRARALVGTVGALSLGMSDATKTRKAMSTEHLVKQANGSYMTTDGRFIITRLRRGEYSLRDMAPGSKVFFGWLDAQWAFPRTLRGARQKIDAARRQLRPGRRISEDQS